MRERILVLDDESSIVDLIKQLLEEEGYTPVGTPSALEALELLNRESFDLLLTDLRMPEMHGMEVLRRAKEAHPDLSVIVVTALVEVTNAIEALRSGADDYLLKPFNLAEIVLSVERALERRRLVKENHRYQEMLEQRVQEATKELEAANYELRTTKEYLENLINSSVDAILTIDESSALTFVNGGAVQMFGYDRKDLLGASLGNLLSGGEEEVRYLRRMLADEDRIKNYETELAHREGNPIPVNMSVSTVHGPEGGALAYLAICKDITEQKRLETELKEISVKDGLTGLYNQRYFYERLEAEIERARRQRHQLSLLLFDIDDFKSYNDSHGHLDGDKVLQAAGQAVGDCTREHVDFGFRYGGDEFTVILPEADQEQAQRIAERIRTTFEARRFDHLTLSLGLATFRDGTSTQGFIRAADAMMYEAKRDGGNRVYLYPRDAEQPAPPSLQGDGGHRKATR